MNMMLPPIGLTKPMQGGKFQRSQDFPDAEKKVNQHIRHKYHQNAGGSGPSTRRGSQSTGALGLTTSVSSTSKLNQSSQLGGGLSSGHASSAQRFPLVPQPITGLENFTLEEYERIYANVSHEDFMNEDDRRKAAMQQLGAANSSSDEGSKMDAKQGVSGKFERINVGEIIGGMERDMKNIREFKNFQFVKGGMGAGEKKPSGGADKESTQDSLKQGGGREGGGRSASPVKGAAGSPSEDVDPSKHKSKQDVVMQHVDERRTLKPAVLAELQLQVPYINFKIPGSHETIELVDVRKLSESAMCNGLVGVTLEQLMAAYQRKQKEVLSAGSSVGFSVDFLRKNKLSASVWGHSRSQSVPEIKQVEEEEWYQRAWYRRKYALREKIESKKQNTKTFKKMQREAAEAILREAAEEILQAQRAWIRSVSVLKFMLSVAELKDSKELRRLKMNKRKKEKKEKEKTAAEAGAEGEEGGAPAAGGEEEAEEKSAADLELERVQKIDAMWSLVFYATKMLQRLYKQRTKQRAVSKIVWLFRMVETSSAMKRAVLRFATTLRSIPLRAKVYLANKRKRNAEMELQWTAFEDNLLEDHFRKMRAAVVREAVQAKKKSISSKDDTIMEILEGGGGVNWKQFRVPAQYRKQFVQEQYIDLMLKNQRAMAQMFQTVKRCYMEQAQMVNFLRKMGVEEDQIDKAKTEMEPENNPSTAKFWNLSDQVLEEAIRKIVNEKCRSMTQHPLFLEEHELEERERREAHGSKDSAISAMSTGTTGGNQVGKLPSKETAQDMEKQHFSSDPNQVQNQGASSSGEEGGGFTMGLV